MLLHRLNGHFLPVEEKQICPLFFNEAIPEFKCTLKIAGAIPAMGTQVFFGHANGSDQII
jgi:hypothetical protein